jgi:hypothetical protein
MLIDAFNEGAAVPVELEREWLFCVVRGHIVCSRCLETEVPRAFHKILPKTILALVHMLGLCTAIVLRV